MEYLQPPYLTRLGTEYRHTQREEVPTPYTVHRTPYSGSPGKWPAPLARILPFRRYTPKTPKTPPSPPLLLTPSPGELSAVRALSFLKLNLLTGRFLGHYYILPPQTYLYLT